MFLKRSMGLARIESLGKGFRPKRSLRRKAIKPPGTWKKDQPSVRKAAGCARVAGLRKPSQVRRQKKGKKGQTRPKDPIHKGMNVTLQNQIWEEKGTQRGKSGENTSM